MMKKSIFILLRSCALTSAIAAFAVNATQTVQPVRDSVGTAFASGANATSWTTSAGLGTVVTVIGRYTTDNATGNESGLGIKVKYDETKFTGVTVTALSKKCMIAPPQIQLVAAGSSQAVLGWIDTAVRTTPSAGAVGWPLLADPAATTTTSPCLNPNGDNDTAATMGPAVNLFRFQGTLAPSVGVGNTADIVFSADGNYSYAAVSPAVANMVDQKVTVTAAPAPTIALSSVVSRKAHGPAGGPFVDYDLPLPNFGGSIGAAVGGIDIETRAIGTQGHKIVFLFNSAVTSVGTPTLAAGTGLLAISGASAVAAISGNSVVVTLSAVPDFQRVRVSLPGVNAALSVTANIAFLVGDVVQSLQTTVTDVNFLKSAVGSSTTLSATTFKLDVNTDGNISLTDINAVKSKVASNPPGSL